jgi:hypothetical protein
MMAFVNRYPAPEDRKPPKEGGNEAMPWSRAELNSEAVLRRNTYTTEKATSLRQRAREEAAERST